MKTIPLILVLLVLVHLLLQKSSAPIKEHENPVCGLEGPGLRKPMRLYSTALANIEPDGSITPDARRSVAPSCLNPHNSGWKK